MTEAFTRTDLAPLAAAIKSWGAALGFQAVGIADADLGEAEARLAEWLARGFHGEMDYMARHGAKRARPAALVPGTLRVISARMDYRPAAADAEATLADRSKAYVSRYALGRDYHKVLRARLQRLADRIETEVGGFGYRVFTDSAPVMEVELAARAGLGWRGKHTLAALARGRIVLLPRRDLHRPAAAGRSSDHGALRHLHALHRRLPDRRDRRALSARCAAMHLVPHDRAEGQHPGERCGRSSAIASTAATTASSCARGTSTRRRAPRPTSRCGTGSTRASLAELFEWTEDAFHARLAGSAIHRIGYERWSRNLAVGLGNAPTSAAVVAALRARADDPSALVREHVAWALAQHRRLSLYDRGSGTNRPPGNGFGVDTGAVPGMIPRATRFARVS